MGPLPLKQSSNSFPLQVGPGSGWVMDKLNGSSSRTLVTYVGNVNSVLMSTCVNHLFSIHFLQVDLKGIPIFVMNLVLRRHPFAVHFIRQQMIAPSEQSAASVRPRRLSSVSSDDDDDWSLYQSLDLPDDFVPNADHDSSSEEYGTSYEQSMPMEYFTKLQ